MPKKKKSLKAKRSYTLRDLPIKKQNDVNRYLLELDSNLDKIQALKRPGELWYFTLFGNRSRLYDDISLLQPDLAQWAMSAQKPNHGSNSGDAVVKGIKLFKFKGKGVDVSSDLEDEDYETTQAEFDTIKRGVRQEVKERKEKAFTAAREAFTPGKPKGHRTGITDILEGALKSVSNLQNQLLKQQRSMDKLLKKIKPPTPPKKGKKKNAPSKSGSKAKATSKNRTPAKATQKTGPGTKRTKPSVRGNQPRASTSKRKNPARKKGK